MRIEGFEGNPLMLPRYPTDAVILMEFIRQSSTMIKTYKDANKFPPILFPVTIGWYMCPDSENIKKVMVTLNKMKLQPFPLTRPYDPYGRMQKIIGKPIHQRHLEDFWADIEDEAEARRRRYQRLTLNQIRTFDCIPIPQQLKKDDGRIIANEYE